jgi:hypothetical protein
MDIHNNVQNQTVDISDHTSTTGFAGLVLLALWRSNDSEVSEETDHGDKIE